MILMLVNRAHSHSLPALLATLEKCFQLCPSHCIMYAMCMFLKCALIFNGLFFSFSITFKNAAARMHFMTISKESHRKIWEVTLILSHFYRNLFEVTWVLRTKLPRNLIPTGCKMFTRHNGNQRSLCVAKRYNCRTLPCMKNELRTAEKWKIITFAYSDEENMLVNCRHISCTSSSSFSLFTEFQLIKLYTIM